MISQASEDGKDLYRQSVVASVRGQAELRGEATFRRRSGQIHAETFRLETGDGGSEPVATEVSRFRNAKVVSFGGEIESSRATRCRYSVRLWRCAAKFEQGSRRSFTAWVANVITWQVDSKVEKQEKVDIPAGSVDAWRVRVRPSFEQVDKALDGMIDMLMPPLVVHFAAEPPHRLLRFEFPTGPFKWNPPGLLEATELAWRKTRAVLAAILEALGGFGFGSEATNSRLGLRLVKLVLVVMLVLAIAWAITEIV